MHRALIAITAGLLIATPAYAQIKTPVFVLAETDDEDARGCSVTNESIAASVEAELRHNNVPITYDKNDHSSLRAYFSTIPTSVTPNGECVVVLMLELYEPVVFQSALDGKTHYAQGEYCVQTGLLTGGNSTLQTRLNSMAQNYLNRCLSSYGKSIIK